MLRRPPGPVAQQRKLLLAFATLLLPWLSVADAQQQHPSRAQQQHYELRSPPLADYAAAEDLAARAVAPDDLLDTPHIRRRSTDSSRDAKGRHHADSNNNNNNNPSSYENYLYTEDARALETFALDSSVRAASPPRHRAGPASGTGLSSPQIARSLEDWEVEDFVLLATVDGDLYATDRKTGKERWRVSVDQPMVDTSHFRANVSSTDEDYNNVDHYLWLVEPNHDGGLYLWVPQKGNEGLIKMGYTMKQMVEELSPHNDKDQNIVYTGDKKTNLVTLDAATGRVLKWFGPAGSQVNEMERCLKPNALADMDSDECNNSGTGTITLGRTEYTVGIQRADGRAIASLKYSEWVPNTFDNDLLQQYHTQTMDHRYIASQHDGQVYGFDYGRQEERPLFAQKLASPVARVFDLARPWGATPGSNPELVVLPQPALPPQDDHTDRARSRSIFVNRTEAGSWYALSGQSYPLILNAPAAKANSLEWWERHPTFEMMSEVQIAKALIGMHTLERKAPILTLDAGSGLHDLDVQEELDNGSMIPAVPSFDPLQPGEIVKKASEIAASSVIDLVSNPVVVLIAVFLLFYKQKDLRRWYSSKKKGDLWSSFSSYEGNPTETSVKQSMTTTTATVPEPEPEPEAEPEPEQTRIDHVKLDSTVTSTPAEPFVPDATPPDSPSSKEAPHSVSFADPLETQEKSETGSGEGLDGASPAEQGKKKKAHRGTRGGSKHKKRKAKDKGDDRQAGDDETQVQDDVADAVNKAKDLIEKPTLEPDIQTVTTDPEAVSGPILKMGSFEVNTDQQLGTGSNGTVVFAGTFDGRPVAVKRMLIQFNEIATQETRLLRESDDHPNVIRYFAQIERASFLYIALELCQASLADVIQKPSMFRELAQAGERDMPSVLYQVANGLRYLHSLRIVHRDLKPQNILVNMGRDGKPRLLVSDFGLCKKLETGQSSFGATTAHAAGTTGWRAPELLLDDDNPTPQTLGEHISSSFHSGSHTGSQLVGQDLLMGPNGRRVTRAIDIFSLGLVFFYVLTKGNHPFDCGDRYMREVNIRKGQHNLQPLDVLGDFAYEARDLIESMLSQNPKDRPKAEEVMAHPFFWSTKKRLAFLCDVSDHFEKEPRDPPSAALSELEDWADETITGDFLKKLPKEFVDSLGKQRKYTGTKMLDLLRALRNKRNHYEDMPDSLKKSIGPLPDGYLGYWTRRFPGLLIACWNIVYNVGWHDADRFREYYEPQL